MADHSLFMDLLRARNIPQALDPHTGAIEILQDSRNTPLGATKSCRCRIH